MIVGRHFNREMVKPVQISGKVEAPVESRIIVGSSESERLGSSLAPLSPHHRPSSMDAVTVRLTKSVATGYSGESSWPRRSGLSPAESTKWPGNRTAEMRKPKLLIRSLQIWWCLFCWLTVGSIAAQPPASPAQRIARPGAAETELPYNQRPISYSETKPTDPVAQLQRRLDNHELVLTRHGDSGVLQHLLKLLNVPVSSQLLVFSKSSAQARLIKPNSPRAIYFNDDVYVGWVPSSSLIEISAVDAQLGATFYSLEQATDTIKLQRDQSCLLCHLTRSTLRVPGHLVRSFTTDSNGQMQTGWSRITHETAFNTRWAGWYVTGHAAGLGHLGNVFGRGTTSEPNVPVAPEDFPLAKACDMSRYLASTSDVVPHLVLDHQAHGHNLISRLSYETRLGKPVTALEPLVRYLLFLDEMPLAVPVVGNEEYLRWFEQQGPRDEAGRSLRKFDLQTRLFKYRLSYLVDSPAFHNLPDLTKQEIWNRIKMHLQPADSTSEPSVIPPDEATAIQEIVRATRRDLPPGW